MDGKAFGSGLQMRMREYEAIGEQITWRRNKSADGSWADDGVVFANAVVQVNFHKPVVISSIENIPQRYMALCV